MSRIETDAVVIGAGPVGLFALFQLGQARMTCHVVDALSAIGGQLTALYPEKPIYDVPGFPRILAGELVERLTEQAAPAGAGHHLGVQVETLIRLPDGRWELGLTDATAIIASAVLICAGAGAFGPTRPPIAGLDRFEGESVRYWIRRAEEMAGKRVVIAGGGDSAVDWAIALADIAASVTIVHRRNKFRAMPASEAKLKTLAREGRVRLAIPYQLAGVSGQGARIETVELADLSGNTLSLEADMLLPFFGLASQLGPIAQWGLAMEQGRILVDPATMATNLEGVFALGDIAVYPGKLKLISQGFAEAAVAAHAAYPFAHDGEPMHFEHSTTTGVVAGA